MGNRTKFGANGSRNEGVRMRLRTRLYGKEHGIAHQHKRLDDFCAELRERLVQDGARDSMEQFLLFANALEAHMRVEEEVYFPALESMSPHSQPDLGNRLHEHRTLRLGMTIVERAVGRGDTTGSIEALDQLALEVTEHERLEEELIGRITAASNEAISDASQDEA